MNDIQILDCTLRDGGYCNEWKFGFDNAIKICQSLVEADIDIIEIGFLTNKIKYDRNITKFTEISQLSSIIPPNLNGKRIVVMMNCGEYDAERLPDYNTGNVEGIRVAFHKQNMQEALEQCQIIKEKGYKVFVQAMASLSYSDKEFLDLISKVNGVEPYSFYIVDSFGSMKGRELIHLFYMTEHNLADDIEIGFHSHNNMQLALANALSLLSLRTSRNLIIDSSIYGMGRGAGNLNTELLVQYVNENCGKSYELKPLLNVIDEVLDNFYRKKYWGYTLPNYLSAKYNTHPNYAEYLDAKKTLTIENMDEIFSLMDEEQRVNFNFEYIEQLYERYMKNGEYNYEHFDEFKKRVDGRAVLIIAPGKSSIKEKDKIMACINENEPVVISVNHMYRGHPYDFIFVSNLRRYRKLDKKEREVTIVTSNIHSSDVYLKVKYEDLINNIEAVSDNACLMLVNLLRNLNVRKIFIAGLDGYSVDATQNFADENMNFYTSKARFEDMNKGMNQILQTFNSYIPIEFVTTPLHVNIST